ncbi:MAG: phenylalanine--tRNA ligase subunit beta, partial [Nocardioidaceae bacterium]|nr:phenylalanine--tRNA ligase subunit beta [Nocardioidaceae bacterium]
MRVPVSWLREYVDLPAALEVKELADRLTALGLKLEALEAVGTDVSGPLVVGRVLELESEEHSNGKTVRWCQVDVGEAEPRGIVCGADNFARGDLVAVSLPGAVLAGGFEIAARRTYGHVSDGMICSARELGLGDETGLHETPGVVVLGAGEAQPGDDATAVLHLRDDVIEFEINPDRAYALSVRGVAREVATAYGLELRDPATTHAAAAAGEGYPVSIEDPDGCDVFVGLEVHGIDAAAPSPRWLARRVQLAGMRPISLAVDVTNYVMLEL